MTALSGTPHGHTETGTAYTAAAALLNDEFDTSGTDFDFCDWCEHTPCVAVGVHWCDQSPRFLTVEAVRDEIQDLKWEVTGIKNPLWPALNRALGVLESAAWTRSHGGDDALAALASVRFELRKAKEAQS